MSRNTNAGPSSSSETSILLSITSSASPSTSYTIHINQNDDDSSYWGNSSDNRDSSLSDHQNQCEKPDFSECSSFGSLDSSDDEVPLINLTPPNISDSNQDVDSVCLHSGHSTRNVQISDEDEDSSSTNEEIDCSTNEPLPNSSTSLHAMGTTRDLLNSSSCSTLSTYNESSVMTDQGNEIIMIPSENYQVANMLHTTL